EPAGQVLALREREGVDEDVEPVVTVAPAGEDPLDVLVALDVAGLHEGRAERLRQRPDALLDERLDGREPDLGALGVERPGDPPGDRVVVRDAEDQGVPALEKSHARPPKAAVPRPVTAPRRLRRG